MNQGKLIDSERGGFILSHLGYLYNRHSENKDGSKTYWMCRQRPVCTRRATTISPQEGSRVVEVLSAADHAHEPAPEQAHAITAYTRMKRAADEHPEAPPAQIIRNHLPEVPAEAIPYLPERQTMKRTFNRRRQRHLPQNPKTLEELGHIPDEFKVTATGKTFLVYDSYADDDGSDDDEDEEDDRRRRRERILVFSTKALLRILAASNVLQVDGTFETAPDIFTQIVTVHGDYRGETLPLVYALLPDKTQVSYTRMFSGIMSACEEYGLNRPRPETIITDFERGLINAGRATFLDALVRLCLFHLRQSAFRKIQNLGLMAAYRDDEDTSIRDAYRTVVGLAFVPPEEVAECLQEARREMPARMAAFIDYFEETYVVGRRLRARRPVPPRYPPAEWNQHRAALTGEPRTINTLEAWHNRFAIVVGKSHPTIYSLIGEFKKEEADTAVMIRELEAGKKIKQPQRMKYKRINERLRNLVNQYEEYKREGRRTTYMQACGHAVGLN